MEAMDDPRLDKLLWCLRLYKTRPMATAACRAGRVIVGVGESKPGREVHVGEVVTVHDGGLTRTLRLVAFPPGRVAAKRLAHYVEDLTPPAEYERARQAATEHRLARQRGLGRPSKKDRREIDRLFGDEPGAGEL